METRQIFLLKGLHRFQLGNIDTLLFPNENLAAAAVNCRAGLDADIPVTASWLLMLFYLESADDSPAVKPLVVMPQFVDVITLLVIEIPFHQKFSRKIMIASKWPNIAPEATEFSRSMSFVCHSCASLFSYQFNLVVVPMRASLPISRDGLPRLYDGSPNTDARPNLDSSRLIPSGYRPTTESKPITD
jgi:hypothetical protein